MRRLLALLFLIPSIALGQSAAQNLSLLAHSLLSGGIVPYTSGGLGSFSLIANDCVAVNSSANGFVSIGCGGGGGSGTVTTFSFTNGGGFAGSITNPTTTPALSLSINAALPLFGYATSSLPTCNSASKGDIAYTTDGTAALTFCNGASWVNNGGTQFTFAATGCTPSASSGDSTGGSITLAAGPCTSITVTFNGAVGMIAGHLWDCGVHDQTALNAGTWIPAWSQSASTTTTATIPIPAAAGSTDVITFSCTPH